MKRERGKNNMDSENMKIFPVEYLWDGYVLNNDIFNQTGAVKLLPKGEKIVKSKLDKLLCYFGNDKNIMVYKDTYIDLISDDHVPCKCPSENDGTERGIFRITAECGQFVSPSRSEFLAEQRKCGTVGGGDHTETD